MSGFDLALKKLHISKLPGNFNLVKLKLFYFNKVFPKKLNCFLRFVIFF